MVRNKILGLLSFGIVGLLFSVSLLKGERVVMVEKGMPQITVVVSEGASEFTKKAVEDLQYYIKAISGSTLPEVHNPEAANTRALLWIGGHHALETYYPDASLSVKEPEEILIKSIGKDLVILGSDQFYENGDQREAGTYLAVSQFIEDQLGVRWLWPGKWGTEIPDKKTIEIASLSYRYTPQLRLRTLNLPNYERAVGRRLAKEKRKQLEEDFQKSGPSLTAWAHEKDTEIRKWLNHHRGDARATESGWVNPLMGSWYSFHNAHGFRDWWKKNHKKHPEWFAMQPDGSRQGDTETPYPDRDNVKMCPSEPGVAEKWLKDAKEFFGNDTLQRHPFTYSASERDMGWQGYCLCERCLSWDNKDAELLEREIRWKNESRPFYALSDRYAKLWNILAKGLKEEFPDKDYSVSVYAYHVTRPAPTIELEENIIPIYVGMERRFYARNSDAHTQDQRRIWKNWWKAVRGNNKLIWRPNMMYKNLGLPYIFTKRHTENMNFMAEHGLAGVVTDSGISASGWATQGPQLYLAAKLLWNPYLSRDEILKDYYEQAFGPAASYIEEYFQLFEDLYSKLANQYSAFSFATYSDPPKLFREVRLDDKPATGRLGNEGITPHRAIEKEAEALLKKAEEVVANSEEKYKERVAFIRTGFQFIEAQLDSIEGMNHYRDNSSLENRERAREAIKLRREVLVNNLDNFAFSPIFVFGEAFDRPQDLGTLDVVRIKETKEDRERLLQQLEQ